MLLCTAAAMTAVSTGAQVRWNPSDWKVVDGNNTRMVNNSEKEVQVTPMSGKDHCHIYNAVDLTFTSEEPYLIIHFEATEGIRANKQHTAFKFYNELEKYGELTEEQINSYAGYVFNESFNVDKGDGYVVYRGKYNDSDEDIFTNGWGYDNTVGRGNIWVIDLRQVPTPNGGYIFDKEDIKTFSITNVRNPWWTTVDGAPARMRSALQIEICTNVTPSGIDKAEFLADKYIFYRYIATAKPEEIETSTVSRANSDKIDIDKVRGLIDNYREKANDANDYDESKIRVPVMTGVETVAANGLNVTVRGNHISCEGASTLEVYNLTGCLVAATEGAEAEVCTGLYIVRATAADGTVKTGKIIVK